MNLLFVSIAFPPKGDPESLQVLKYYTALKSKEGLSISIVSSKNPTLFMEPNADLVPYLTGYSELIELPIRESKYLNFLKRKLRPNCLNYPDSKHSFYKQYKNALSQIKNVPDIIYSRSFPLSSTILAFKLAEKYDKPWVLHLSDPWTFKMKSNNDMEESEIWNLEWEEKCFNRASIICLTSKKTIEFYSNKYPQFIEKFHFYPNVYDLNEVQKEDFTSNVNKKRTQFLYTGGLTHERNPELLLICLKELNKEYPNLMQSTNFKFIGPKDSFVLNLFKEYSLPFVEEIKHISYFQTKEYQKKSDVLLLIDAPINDPLKSVFFPSKLLDYMLARKPILAISPSFSTTSDVINEYQLGTSFSHNQKENIKSFMIECIQGNYEFNSSNNILPKDFDVNFNVDRLYNLFLQLNAKV